MLAVGGLSVAEIAGAGAQRISVGGALAMTAFEAMAGAAEQIRDHGDFSGLASSRRVRRVARLSAPLQVHRGVVVLGAEPTNLGQPV